MKNAILIITAVLAVLLVSCGKSPDSDEVQTHPENDIPIITTTEATELTESTEGDITTAEQTNSVADKLVFEAVYNPENGTNGAIEISITNNSEEELYYGADAKVEVLKDGNWEFYWEPEAYDLWLADILPGDIHSDTVYLDSPLPAGTYRVCRKINDADCFSNEFVVE